MPASRNQRFKRTDQGFTLIELMIVLLIIAILLAVAIPTFLGERSTANARTTQENLRNALTAEAEAFATTQSFSADLHYDEPSLKWETSAPIRGANDVLVSIYAYDSSTSAWDPGAEGSSDGVELTGYSRDNNCYDIFQSNNVSLDFAAYYEVPAGTTGCTAVAPPTAEPARNTSASGATTPTWSASF